MWPTWVLSAEFMLAIFFELKQRVEIGNVLRKDCFKQKMEEKISEKRRWLIRVRKLRKPCRQMPHL